MVSGVIFHVLLVVAALALAALVAAPLRKSSPRAFAALVLVTPLLAVALYRIVGTPAAFDADTVATTASAQDAPTMEQAVAELEATLARDPAQPEGWRLLARAHASLGNHTKARDAYMTALQHIPDDPELLVEAAQSRAQAEPGNRFDDEALAMLRQALVLDPA
ncbi:MAG TPA: tetratricopeptide repeat protein, partial [Luteimonas sp.]|nr:tetratricopeptide repeat protein [Luteimonas sp.]